MDNNTKAFINTITVQVLADLIEVRFFLQTNGTVKELAQLLHDECIDIHLVAPNNANDLNWHYIASRVYKYIVKYNMDNLGKWGITI